MIADDFDEMIGWIEIRWPNLRWTSVTVAALFEDLQQFDGSDVWAAIHRLYEKGTDFAPTPSVIIATCLEERRLTAERERANAWPALNPGRSTWPEYARRIYGTELSLWAAAEEEHRRLEDCNIQTCKIHKKKVH